jgi:hypothetical protein
LAVTPYHVVFPFQASKLDLRKKDDKWMGMVDESTQLNFFCFFERLEQWPFLLPICVAGFVILGAEIMGSERKCVLCV